MSEMSNWVLVAQNDQDGLFYRIAVDESIALNGDFPPVRGTWAEMRRWSTEHDLSGKFDCVWIVTEKDTFIITDWIEAIDPKGVSRMLPSAMVPIVSFDLDY